MPTRRTLLTLLAAAAATACTAPPAFAVGSLVDVQIIDRDQGNSLAAYRYRGASYVAGRPGDRYAVRLVNRSAGRVLVVLSIDGVNAVSGETASVGQTGYVLAPYASAEITGWRKSLAEAAAFYFTALPDSYAARTERPDNVGVIGAAVFRERMPEMQSRVWEEPPRVARDSLAGADRNKTEGASREDARRAEGSMSAQAAAPAPPVSPLRERDAFADARKLGTGHGEREYSPTSQTTFERATQQPAEIVQVRYDSYANLIASGVIHRPQPLPRQPDAFPGFVPDPR